MYANFWLSGRGTGAGAAAPQTLGAEAYSTKEILRLVYVVPDARTGRGIARQHGSMAVGHREDITHSRCLFAMGIDKIDRRRALDIE